MTDADGTSRTQRLTLFQAALRERWDALPPEVQALHSVEARGRFVGRAAVTRGRSFAARAIAWFFGFPPETDDVPVTVLKTRIDGGEVWERDFGGRVFRSVCAPSAEPYCCRERFWPFNFELELRVEDGAMHLPVRRGWFLGVQIPGPLLPSSNTTEYARGGEFCFDVSVSAPFGQGLIVRYRGNLRPDGEFAA